MNRVRINADYNASLTIRGRSSSVNDKDINLYDSKITVLKKIVDSFMNKLPQNHYSLVESLENKYFNTVFEANNL